MPLSGVGVKQMIELSKDVLGYPITVTATLVGSDWNIIISGGCAPHVGSVSLAEFRNNVVTLRTLVRDSHKDQIIGDLFARTLAAQLQCTVSASCGIHFDNPSPDDLNHIISVSKLLLNELCEKIQ